MDPIIVSARVMQNYTVCIVQPIREQMGLAQGDRVILSMDAKGDVSLLKGVSGLDDLIGIGKDTFETPRGWENFIKKERTKWGK